VNLSNPPLSNPNQFSPSLDTFCHDLIPRPNHPKQYRAIGVVYGKYTPMEGKLTKGVMETKDQEKFDVIILPRAIGAIKNHVDVSQKQHWIVYPHGIRDSEQLYLQIVGILPPSQKPEIIKNYPSSLDYFSIRGEVLYFSHKAQKVIVKIRYYQTSTQRIRFFKLELKGIIDQSPLNHFYDFDVVLEGTDLIIKRYIDLGLIAVKNKRRR
jgi:hypothetical protein